MDTTPLSAISCINHANAGTECLYLIRILQGRIRSQQDLSDLVVGHNTLGTVQRWGKREQSGKCYFSTKTKKY